MSKRSPRLVVEIPEFTGLRLSDASLSRLEQVLTEAGTILAAKFPAPIDGNQEALNHAVAKQMEKSICAIEQGAPLHSARQGIVTAAACLLAQVLLIDLETRRSEELAAKATVSIHQLQDRREEAAAHV